MQEFQDKGGFSRVLQDIFNPKDLKSLELDSVFQIKKFVREFYSRKTKMSNELLETLDALQNERPGILKLKRKHFDLNKAKNATKREQFDMMRLNTERDRVDKFKQIALKETERYYRLLEIFAAKMEQRKEVKLPTSTQMDSQSKNGGSSDAQSMYQEADFQSITEKMNADIKLMKTLSYITEYMRQVIENGTGFTHNHMFILLLHMTAD